MCLILLLQTDFKSGCNHLWCRTHELEKIHPTLFVPFSAWPLLEMASVGCLETFHSEQGPGIPCICYYTFLYAGNSFWGKDPQENSFSPKQGLKAFTVPCCSASCAVGKGSAISARAQAWQEKQLSKTGHSHHSAGVSRSAGVEANLVCRRFYKVRK